MIGAPARWSPRFRLAFFRYQQLLHGRPPWRCRGTRLRALATTPPSTFRRCWYSPRRAAGVAGDCRAWGVRRVPVRTLPQIQSGTRRSHTLAGWEEHPFNTAASLGRARSPTSTTSRVALHAPASPLGSVMMANCSGRAATGVAVDGVRTRCGGRRLVWVGWKVGQVPFVGSGWRPWLVSTERPGPSI